MKLMDKIATALLRTETAKAEIDLRARQQVRAMLADELEAMRQRVQKCEENAELLRRFVEPIATANYLTLDTNEGERAFVAAMQEHIDNGNVTIDANDIRGLDGEVEREAEQAVERFIADSDLCDSSGVRDIASDVANDVVGDLRIVRD